MTPAMQPVTGSKTYNVGSMRVNIIMWNVKLLVSFLSELFSAMTTSKDRSIYWTDVLEVVVYH